MHDIKRLREDPKAFDQAMVRRGLREQSGPLLKLDEKHREIQRELQSLQSERNTLSKEVGQRKGQKDNGGEEVAELMQQVADMKDRLHELEQKEREIGEELDTALAELPNVLVDSVPDGDDERSNHLEREWGEIPSFDFRPKPHYELGEDLAQMDFERAAKVSGSRFVFLYGALAQLERALANFMLSVQTQEFGYTEVYPPYLVRSETLFGTGQLPKFAEDQFKTTDDHWLIPTAEVVLTNIYADEILDAAKLPLRFTAYTPCFRSEAGAAGRDTRGMIRQHQFSKVELVSIVHPDESDEELERKTNCAEEILKLLKLPYRVMTLCAGDTGFAAMKTYDLEVWLPGQEAYREISSCSNTGDFQARRMKCRFREAGDKKTRHVHTLNGSGLAVGRTLVAVMENYQQADGSIAIPEVLQPFMGGRKVITAEDAGGAAPS